jgi:hypothetical protein
VSQKCLPRPWWGLGGLRWGAFLVDTLWIPRFVNTIATKVDLDPRPPAGPPPAKFYPTTMYELYKPGCNSRRRSIDATDRLFYFTCSSKRFYRVSHRACPQSSECPGRVHRPRRAQQSNSYFNMNMN